MARILIACEESQATTKEFRALGHEAFSCDLLPCSGGHPEWHYQCNALDVINNEWDMNDIRTKPHKVRSSLSSKTFQGTAKAFAEQWGKIL